MKNLLRAERELTIRGELKLMRPGIRRSYDLAEPREGAVMKVGAGEVELKRYEEKADGSARLELVARNAGGVVEVEGLGPEKQAVARTHRSSFSTGETTRISIGLREAPSSLLVTWHGDSSPEIIEFELKGVPLVQAETRPLAHKSLKFKGSSPVTLESDGRLLRDGGSMFPEIVLRLRNHSNKDIREIEAEVSYLNAEGEKLNRGNTTLRGDPMEMARRQDPRWLPADSERRHRAKLVLAKKEAATAELTPRKVLFTDGSEWFAPVSCPKDQRPCILGKIRTPAGAKSQVLSGYTGIDSKDSRAWGLTSVEVGPDSLSHWSRNGSDWGKNSAMHAMGDGVAHHQHEEVAEGSYLVFAARKEGGPVDWKWVKIDAPDQQLRVDLDLSRASSGSLEVKVPHAGGADDEVSLTPLNATGPYPLPLESLTKLRAGDMLKLKAKVNGGLALFEGLFPGRYLVHSGKHTEETQVTQGKRSQVSFP